MHGNLYIPLLLVRLHLLFLLALSHFTSSGIRQKKAGFSIGPHRFELVLELVWILESMDSGYGSGRF
ncbi:hypothetical protein P171DRAFT_428720 [Karstenula rhodostoma CBS 690.94]|uniref:Uncharacterized protein n=1 Tax=Karstenula rhodostoma CBS 690.94 TaxID=1392251 RepID=A0A9P4PTJ4_9PLEO|nr:hypothetical protein P171DRAFT_428720 [Karstenula rhodostoma CBS 690.94]